MLTVLISIIIPIAIVVLIGYAWNLFGGRFDRQFSASLAMNLGAPCMIVVGLIDQSNSFGDLVLLLIAGVAMQLLIAGVGKVLLIAFRLDSASYLFALIYGNTGNLGIPICFLVLGQEGLGAALAIFLANIISQSCVMPIFFSSQTVVRTISTTPVVYAGAASAIILYGDITLPGWSLSSMELLSGFTIPLMLMSLGYSLRELRISRLGISLVLALTRLVLGLGAGWCVAEILDLDGMMRTALLIQSLMPTGVFVYLMAEKYRRQPEDIAGVVVCSTGVSVLAMPFALSVLAMV